MTQPDFALFASVRAETTRLAEGFAQPQLDFSPRAGRWSIGEVLDHVLLAQQLYHGEIGRLIDLKRAGRRPYLKRTFADINVAPFFVPEAVLPWLETPFTVINWFIPGVVVDVATRYAVLPMRNPDRATPRPRRPGAELRAELIASLRETEALLAANADLDFREMISEHPLTGVSNVPQILHFLARHEQRHQTQIAAVKSDHRFPA